METNDRTSLSDRPVFDHVIRKGELFYRPGARGYTPNVNEAGLWTRTGAEQVTRGLIGVAGVTVHLRSGFVDANLEEIARTMWRDGKWDESEDRCDMDVNDLDRDHPVWMAASALLEKYTVRSR